jgi:hypothetical protein
LDRKARYRLEFATLKLNAPAGALSRHGLVIDPRLVAEARACDDDRRVRGLATRACGKER